ncbi:MAG: nuclear transport factor 2 family protein [Flavobacteriia bacterium]|nr:nuclear transport factor 2 family protein [Flavobacteriia bacterium]
MKTLVLFTFLFLLNQFYGQLDTLNQIIDGWHKAASDARFNDYFDLMSENSIFIGTAPNERWNKKEFMEFSKPYFDRGKAWDFKAKNRTWSISSDGKVAWFDEELATWMESCRGSGVVVKEGEQWKIVFYDLHVQIENDKIKEFIQLRKK